MFYVALQILFAGGIVVMDPNDDHITEAAKDFITYGSLLRSKLAAIVTCAVRVPCVDGSFCLQPVPFKDVGLTQKRAIQPYNIETTPDGLYWRMRYQKPGQYVKNPDGSDRWRRVVRKSNEQEFLRRDLVKGSIFLHHLAELASGRIPRLTGRYGGELVRITCSHLCGNAWCCNARHICREPHPLNQSRSQCCYEWCVHETRCLRGLQSIHAKILALEERFAEEDVNFDEDSQM